MPSFDVVSEVDAHELTNAVDQSSRELTTRFDFRGIEASYQMLDKQIRLAAPEEFQLDQMELILREKLAKRKVDSECLKASGSDAEGKLRRRTFDIREGVDADTARTVIRMIKDGKFKVQTTNQGDRVRVTGKKRDDLQEVIAMLRGATLDLPLQYVNFRD